MKAELQSLDRRVLTWIQGGWRTSRLNEVGPFALLRAVPQLGFLLIAVIIASDLAYAGHELAADRTPVLVDANGKPVVRTSAAPSAGPTAAAATGPVDPQVGPDSALDIKTYFSDRHKALRALAASGTQGSIVAVVSFTRGVRPSDLLRATYGTAVSSVLVHVTIKGRPTGAAVVPVPAGPLAQTVPAAVRPAVAPLLADATANQHQGDTLTVVTSDDQAQKADYYAEAQANKDEADELRFGGAYVYAVVITGSPSLLLGLASHPGIRLVDPGDPGLPLDRVDARGIFPEDTATVSDVTPLEGLSR